VAATKARAKPLPPLIRAVKTAVEYEAVAMAVVCTKVILAVVAEVVEEAATAAAAAVVVVVVAVAED
jgi:hypothetical protein